MARRRLNSLAVLAAACVALASAGSAHAATINAVEGASVSIATGSILGSSITGDASGCMDPMAGMPGIMSSTSVAVSWGDGSTPVPATIVWTAAQGALGMPASCTGKYSASHVYEAPGTFAATATMTTTWIGMPIAPMVSTESHVVVVAPTPITGSVTPWAATAGVGANGAIATFTTGRATDASRFLAKVEWGDGTTSLGTVAAVGAAFTVSDAHTYVRAGAYTVKVSALDLLVRGAATSFSGTLNVAAQVATEGPGQSNLGRQCVVPKLVGLKLAAAKSAIAKAGCKVGKVTAKKGPKAKAGKVVKAPKVGTKLALNAKLALSVGK